MRLLPATALLGALLSTGAGSSVPDGEPAPVIVSAAWLSRHLRDSALVVVQSGGAAEYARGHIPGSVLLPSGGLEKSDMGEGGSMDMTALPGVEELQPVLQRLGVSNGSHVIVVFATEDLPQATRVIALMRYAGVSRVSLLDGGLGDWRQNGLPLNADQPSVRPGHFSAPLDLATVVDYRYVQARERAPHVRLIDARAPVYYDGPVEQGSMAMRPGHIPGARNIPYSSLFDGQLRMRPRQEIDEMFRQAGVLPGDTVVAYCHVGIQATVVILAARLAGYPARLYPGSFHDWSDRHLPTEGGSK
ncbi:MAG TPA: rhodanese-like domain-containing protein [Gemmatimonadales bacterium]|nr:rhodanese-like domain-containing protein [Gemmatimonadales bacterium]